METKLGRSVVVRSIATTARICLPWETKLGRFVVVRSAATIAQKVHTMVGKIGSRRSSCDSHHLAEMSTMVDKTCLVSESFGSSSVASLRTPPTWFHRVRACVRACAGGNDFTISDCRPVRPQRPPEHPPLLGLTRLPPNPHRIGNRQAKGRNRLSDSAVVVHWGNSRLIRQVIPSALGAFLVGAPSKGNPFAAPRPLTHCRTFSRFRGSYSPRCAYCLAVSPAIPANCR